MSAACRVTSEAVGGVRIFGNAASSAAARRTASPLESHPPEDAPRTQVHHRRGALAGRHFSPDIAHLAENVAKLPRRLRAP